MKVNDLKERLQKAKIDEALGKIGLDFTVVFPNFSEKDPYCEYEWSVRKNDDFLIVNAVPKDGKELFLFWEEWYVQKSRKEIHHHVLSLWKPAQYDEVFAAPASDDGLHPAVCCGRSWYVVDDPDMTAVLLRR